MNLLTPATAIHTLLKFILNMMPLNYKLKKSLKASQFPVYHKGTGFLQLYYSSGPFDTEGTHRDTNARYVPLSHSQIALDGTHI